MLMKSYYQRKNCKVRVAHTPEHGLQLIQEAIPDVILLIIQVCINPKVTIRQIKEVAPDAELIVNDPPNYGFRF